MAVLFVLGGVAAVVGLVGVFLKLFPGSGADERVGGGPVGPGGGGLGGGGGDCGGPGGGAC